MKTEEQKQKHREYQKRWAAANPGYKKEWRHHNIDRVRQKEREQSRAYHQKNPERVRAWNKADRERRKEQVAAAKKEYSKKNAVHIRSKVKLWKANNRERKRALHQAYKKRHPEKSIEQNSRRRCKLLAVGIGDCISKIALLRKERFCHWCCAPLSKKKLEIDHVTPVSRGGAHVPDNLVAACSTCNQSKGSKLVSEWTWREAA